MLIQTAFFDSKILYLILLFEKLETAENNKHIKTLKLGIDANRLLNKIR